MTLSVKDIFLPLSLLIFIGGCKTSSKQVSDGGSKLPTEQRLAFEKAFMEGQRDKAIEDYKHFSFEEEQVSLLVLPDLH